MSLPVERILWAPTNSAHGNHLHVVGDPRFTGTPPPNNPGMSDAVWTIYVALAERFGEPAYFLDADGTEGWTHMGWYNRRHINNDPSRPWSQHAWSNALDIGPYYGVEEQQKFYDFLTGKEEDMPTIEEIEAVFEKKLNERFGKPITIPGEANRPTNQGVVNGALHAKVDGVKVMDLIDQAANKPIRVDVTVNEE